jgi:predicted outer membrane protein
MNLQATLLAGAIALIPALARADDTKQAQQPTATDRSGAQMPPSQTAPTDHRAMDHGSKQLTDSQVLMKLHHINKEEIEVGQIAQKNGGTRDVKDFGATLVRDHTQADQDVTALASKVNVDLEAKKADAKHQEKQQVMQNKIDQLKKTSGKDFDRAFAQMMVNGHRQAIEMVKDARGTVQSVELKSLLEKLLPTLQKHEDIANDILNKLGNTASAK